jgi:hypothetical protein
VTEINLSLNTDLARDILAGFIKSEITRVGMSRAIINFSADSTPRFRVRLLWKPWGRKMYWHCACPIALHPLIL